MILKWTKIVFLYYFPALLWMGIIFYFSSFHDIRTGTSSVPLEIILRKMAHAAEFAVLCFLFFRILANGHGFSPRKAFVISLAMMSFYAATDEIHQMFVAGREAKVFDVLIDIFGGFTGVSVIVGIRKKIIPSILFFLMLSLFVGMVAYRTWESIGRYGMIIEKTLPVSSSENEKQNAVEPSADLKLPQVEIAEEKTSEQNENLAEKKVPDEKLPDKIHIQVPFTTQAPFSVWDARHEEACEEASLIMIKYFLDGKNLNKEIAEREIQEIMDFEIKKYGDDTDSTAQEVVQLAKDYYGINNLRVVYDFDQADIKTYLSRQKPIIVPAAGRLLGNPNFTAPGPPYHNLVLVGYEGNTIITNDPGTRKGQDYRYPIETLYSAIHDFPGDKDKMNQGRKAMIVLE